jgi:hypothetical protein
MDRAKIRNSVGLDMKPATPEEYQKIVKSFEGQDEQEAVDEYDDEQYKKLVQYTLLKLLSSPGFVKGYVQNVVKVIQVKPDEKEALDLIKEEVEQTISEITRAAAIKYNVSPARKFDKTKY